MRLCFYNPHAVSNVFGVTVLSRITQMIGRDKRRMRKHNLKYEWMLNLLRNPDIETAIVVDGTDTSFSAILQKWSLLKNNRTIHWLISAIEIYWWCWLNKLNPLKQKILWKKTDLDEKNDILFTFAYFCHLFCNPILTGKSIYTAFNGKKILHASHYYIQTATIARILESTGTTLMAAEADLKKSAFFSAFFPTVNEVYLLSHVLRERYKNQCPFQERKNLCLALGTLVLEPPNNNPNKDFMEFFDTDCLHPIRKAIYLNKERLSNVIDSRISLHNAVRRELTQKSKLYNTSKLYRMFAEAFLLKEGSSYHAMDIVKTYNEYRMFVAPEECIGLPSVNVVEGMACGSAFIGIVDPMYTDLGMEPEKHYISYNGTLEDLERKIRYYQSHPNELETIAENGCNFVKANCTEEVVTKRWVNYLKTLLESNQNTVNKSQNQHHAIAPRALEAKREKGANTNPASL